MTESPADLAALFPLFDVLEQGRSVALVPIGGVGPGDVAPPTEPGPWIGVTSSGSTGRPKLVWRRWPELRAGASRRPEVQRWRWASPYGPSSFAGVQVALQAWATSREIVSWHARTWDEVWASVRQERIDAVSGTPTFLDLMVQSEGQPGSEWQPVQVTLGGEPLRPGVGRRLRARFPGTRFIVIYASAEFGVLMRTERLDGWYEAASLARRWPEWRIRDEVLEVADHGTWRATGDRVVAQGDLLKVVGRADQVANIAGTKVDLAGIIELAEQVPGVLRAVAVAESSPITGQIVCLRYALDPHQPAEAIEALLQEQLRASLPKAAWPRRWVRDAVAPVKNAKRAV
ncbi:MAG TPA: class I adenylate-forming enzyme family protein [Verrucomicrobiota bacterium]|nr:class I adenylate-forming enzyme family protein [Verrucomicrobiota bacterium]